MWIICLVWCWLQVLEFQFEFGAESPAAFWGARLGWAGACVFPQQKNKSRLEPRLKSKLKKQTDSNPDSNSLLLSPDLLFFLSTFCYLSLQLSVCFCVWS